jgi:hypothetical protein
MKGYLFVRGIGNNYNVFSTTPEEKSLMDQLKDLELKKR